MGTQQGTGPTPLPLIRTLFTPGWSFQVCSALPLPTRGKPGPHDQEREGQRVMLLQARWLGTCSTV
jgi:hypothetical protein